jgi:hypothetical protein
VPSGLIATQIELIPYDIDMLARDISSGRVQMMVQEKSGTLDMEIKTSKDTHMQNLYNSTGEYPIVYEMNFTEYRVIDKSCTGLAGLKN